MKCEWDAVRGAGGVGDHAAENDRGDELAENPAGIYITCRWLATPIGRK